MEDLQLIIKQYEFQPHQRTKTILVTEIRSVCNCDKVVFLRQLSDNETYRISVGDDSEPMNGIDLFETKSASKINNFLSMIS